MGVPVGAFINHVNIKGGVGQNIPFFNLKPKKGVKAICDNPILFTILTIQIATRPLNFGDFFATKTTNFLLKMARIVIFRLEIA